MSPATTWTEATTPQQGWDETATLIVPKVALFCGGPMVGIGEAHVLTTYTEASVAATSYTEASVAASAWTELTG